MRITLNDIYLELLITSLSILNEDTAPYRLLFMSSEKGDIALLGIDLQCFMATFRVNMARLTA